MISYELALRLKEAGFPPPEILTGTTSWVLSKTHGQCYVVYDGKTAVIQLFPGYTYDPEIMVYAPTLSEFIEACGDKFYRLHKIGVNFMADDINGKFELIGSTPEEAVAQLYLALHRK